MWLLVEVLCVDLLKVHQGSLASEEMSVKAKAESGINSQNIIMTTMQKFKIKISWHKNDLLDNVRVLSGQD